MKRVRFRTPVNLPGEGHAAGTSSAAAGAASAAAGAAGAAVGATISEDSRSSSSSRTSESQSALARRAWRSATGATVTGASSSQRGQEPGGASRVPRPADVRSKSNARTATARDSPQRSQRSSASSLSAASSNLVQHSNKNDPPLQRPCKRRRVRFNEPAAGAEAPIANNSNANNVIEVSSGSETNSDGSDSDFTYGSDYTDDSDDSDSSGDSDDSDSSGNSDDSYTSEDDSDYSSVGNDSDDDVDSDANNSGGAFYPEGAGGVIDLTSSPILGPSGSSRPSNPFSNTSYGRRLHSILGRMIAGRKHRQSLRGDLISRLPVVKYKAPKLHQSKGAGKSVEEASSASCSSGRAAVAASSQSSASAPPPLEAASCVVCMCDFEDGEEITILPRCLHKFHMDCIKPWLKKSTKCPICKQEVIADDMHDSSSGFSRPSQVHEHAWHAGLNSSLLETTVYHLLRRSLAVNSSSR
eukprot:g4356.t1